MPLGAIGKNRPLTYDIVCFDDVVRYSRSNLTYNLIPYIMSYVMS